jgi:hypothetical protein
VLDDAALNLPPPQRPGWQKPSAPEPLASCQPLQLPQLGRARRYLGRRHVSTSWASTGVYRHLPRYLLEVKSANR